jgi:hypothetical protein
MITVWGRNGDEGHVHHLDGDHTHNVGANLAAAHNSCHQRHHIWENVGEAYMLSKPPEVRAKIAATLTGRKDSDGTRRRKSDAAKRSYAEGRRVAPPGRPKGIVTRTEPCPHCGREISANNLPRHVAAHG